MLDDVSLLTAPGLKELLDQGQPLVVLDVREDDERAHTAIALPDNVANLHIPMGFVTSRFEEVKQAAVDRSLVVYCHHGQRSMVVARWLAMRGIGKVHNLEGGIDAWSTQVDRAIRRY